MHKDLEQLKAEKERWVTKIFWLGVEIAVIFAVPAAVGVWIGKKYDNQTLTFVALLVAFFLSWAVVIMRFRRVSRKIKSLESEIEQHEHNEHQ